jgi:hypothetical protein
MSIGQYREWEQSYKPKSMMFSQWAVARMLDGVKHVTRRPVKAKLGGERLNFQDVTSARKDVTYPDGRVYWKFLWPLDERSETGSRIQPIATVKCPYQEGEWRWVRETMRVIELRENEIRVRYGATQKESDWLVYPERLKHRPSRGRCLPYGGYFEASRLRVQIGNVRPEKLRLINYRDVVLEGVQYFDGLGTRQVLNTFGHIWNSHYRSPYRWADDPWVWRIEMVEVINV